MIVAGVSSLLLYLDWAGKEYGWSHPDRWRWSSPRSTAGGRCSSFVEQRAAEPIIPLRLFRNPVFTIGNIYGFLAGIAMFGAIIFLPLLSAGRDGDVADRVRSGDAAGGLRHPHHVDHLRPADHPDRALQDLPDRRRGDSDRRAALLSRLEVDTPYWQVALLSLLFGVGLGMTMQTIVTAVQNAVEYRDMGTATSSTTFFRQMGGAIGAAVFGAILASRLARPSGRAARSSSSSRRRVMAPSTSTIPGYPGAAGTGQDVRADGLYAGARRRLPGRRSGGGAGLRGRALPEGDTAAHHAAAISRRRSCRRIGGSRGAQRRLVM